MSKLNETDGIPKRRKKKALVVGFITIGFPFFFKLFTIYTLLVPGGQSELQGVFFYVIVALNFLCLLCLGIIWTADLRYVVLENRTIRKLLVSNSNSINITDRKKQVKTKWVAFYASIINTLSSIAIAAILYTQETTVFNLLMLVLSVLSILLDVSSLYSIFLLYKKNPQLKGPLVNMLDSKFTKLQGKIPFDKLSPVTKLHGKIPFDNKPFAPIVQTSISAMNLVK